MYENTLRKTWVEIDLKALESNIVNIKKKLGDDVFITGVVKADAYGHGAVECAKVMRDTGVERFGVATITEGIELREAGITEPIVVLGLTPDECADQIVEYGLTPVICSIASARAVSAEAVREGKPVDGLVALDTGMGRIGYLLGADDEEERAAAEIAEMMELEGFNAIGIMSHFSSSDEESREYTDGQLAKFNEFIERLAGKGIEPDWITISNSGAVLDYPEAKFDVVRPGILLYGCYPSESVSKDEVRLTPVMSVKANIVFIKDVPEGVSISYGRKFTTERRSRIATISIGYADGYPRTLTGKAEVLIKGRRAKVVGSICMDQCMIDVTDIPDVKMGDEVVVMGTLGDEAITAEELAEKTGTINYEILCGFGMRLPKVYL
jgi:alanine racemase